MELHVLGTGSSGNCYALIDQEQALLLDAGLPAKRIARAVGQRDIVGCLITHEHQDHCRGAQGLWQKGVRLYGTSGTRKALPYLEPVETAMQLRNLGNFVAKDFPVLHDTPDPCGWLIANRRTGERLLYATDTCGLMYTFPGVHYWLIECNYMEDKAACYDVRMQHRLKHTHMELETLCAILRGNDLRETRAIILCHMSQERGDAKAMADRVRSVTGKEVIVAKNGARIPLELEPF